MNALLDYMHGRLFSYFKMLLVGSRFAAQVQNVWDFGPVSPIQQICREWVEELSSNDFDNS